MKIDKNFIYKIIIAFLFLLVSGCVSLLLGQDANWDLKNYHIYNAWSFLNERHSVDVAAAGIQTYFSPYLDLPYYYLSIELFPENPKTVAFIFGFPYGILLICVFYIYKIGLGEMQFNGWLKYVLLIVYGLIGVSGVSAISQVAATFNEMYVAMLVMIALALSVKVVSSGNIEIKESNWILIIIGFFAGLACGLKLTSCVYVVSIILSFMIMDLDVKNKMKIGAFLTIGVSGAFLLSYMPWGGVLYEKYGNPFFPMFNAIFKSEWSDLTSGFDSRFLPKNIQQYIYYPLVWANKSEMTVMEPIFEDWRFAIAFYALLVQIVFFQVKRNFISSSSFVYWRKNSPITYFVLSFFVISYALWVVLFSILRYAIPTEVMTGFVILTGVVLLAKIYFPNRLKITVLFMSCLVGLYIFSTTKYPDWGRVKFGDRVFDVRPPIVEDGSLVIIIGKPLAFYAPFIAKNKTNISYLGYSDKILTAPKSKLREEFLDKISSSSGQIYALVRYESISRIKELEEFGLIGINSCELIKSNIDNDVNICKLKKFHQ
jgi:hypothetical protein